MLFSCFKNYLRPQLFVWKEKAGKAPAAAPAPESETAAPATTEAPKPASESPTEAAADAAQEEAEEHVEKAERKTTDTAEGIAAAGTEDNNKTATAAEAATAPETPAEEPPEKGEVAKQREALIKEGDKAKAAAIDAAEGLKQEIERKQIELRERAGDPNLEVPNLNEFMETGDIRKYMENLDTTLGDKIKPKDKIDIEDTLERYKTNIGEAFKEHIKEKSGGKLELIIATIGTVLERLIKMITDLLSGIGKATDRLAGGPEDEEEKKEEEPKAAKLNSPIKGKPKYEKKGNDIIVKEVKKDTEILAVEKGKIEKVGDDGKSIEIKLEDGKTVRYSQLASVTLKPGDSVKAGAALGKAGDEPPILGIKDKDKTLDALALFS